MKALCADNIGNIVVDVSNVNAVVSKLIDRFYDTIVVPEDQRLLDLAFTVYPKQEDLDIFLKDWDIEAFGGGRALMLSYVMKMHPHLQFSSYEAPRLTGLLKFFRFHNLQVISHFSKVVKALNDANIVPMILKGGALKHIRPDLSRIMGDIDILVRVDDFSKVCEISKDLGYVFGEDSTQHSVDLHVPGSEAGTLDIHQFLDFQSDYDKSFMAELFVRARPDRVFSTDALVPCHEDMLFISLVNLSKNLHNKTSMGGILYTLFDCKYLKETKADFDWSIVISNAIKTNTIVQLLFAMKFANKIVPGLLPEDLLQGKSIDKEVITYCNKIKFYRFYVHDVKMRCKRLKLKNALCNWAVMRDYLDAKPKHFVLKRIRKSVGLTALFLKIANKLSKEGN